MPVSRRALLAAALAAPAVARAQTEAGGRVLSIGVVSDPVTLDPAFSGSFFENQVLYNLHETLLIAEPDGSLTPGLAESWRMADPLAYEFTLRPNMTFHDGTPIDAAACKANIDRYLDPKTGSIRRADFGPVTGAEITGPLSFRLRLSAPYAPLPLVLTNRAGMMVSPKALETLGKDFASRAVGAGAWRFVSWTKNSELVLEKFPGYCRGDKQYFDRLVFRPIADETVRLANLRSGTLQLVDAVPPQAVAALSRESSVRVQQIPSLGFNGWSMNCTRPPFDKPQVRQALVAAVDPEVVQRVVYFGTGRVSRGPLSPSVPWAFDPNFAPPGYDPARARKMLAEAGAGEKLPFAITCTNSPQMVRIAQIIQAQAAAAGFAPQIRQIDATSLLAVLQKHDFDVCMSPWSGRYDPDGNMFFYFTEDGPNNFMGYRSAEVTAALKDARSGTDRAKRVELYHAAQDRLGRDAPMLFLHFDAIIQAGSAKLSWRQYPDAVFRLYDARDA